MNHYFTNENVISNERKITIKIKDVKLEMFVDNGVFSKNGLDFGTRTLLESIDENIKGDVLDFGCGYGPIGIYLSKVYDVDVDMVDINKRCLKLALKNSSLNKVKTNVFESNIYENINKKYDYIITNPPIRVGKKILYKILFSAKYCLKENGKMYLVIHKDQGAKSLLKDLLKEYKAEVISKNKGFYVIKVINEGAFKEENCYE